MRRNIERALWGAIIVGSIYLLLAAGAAYGSPPPRHARLAKGNLPALRLSLLRQRDAGVQLRRAIQGR